jgi:hypothetical protein
MTNDLSTWLFADACLARWGCCITTLFSERHLFTPLGWDLPNKSSSKYGIT